MLDEYERELVKEILSELEKIEEKTFELERIEKIALTLLRKSEEVDTIPVSHYV